MSLSSIGLAYHTTFLKNRLSSYGFVRNTGVPWGDTGGRVSLASTHCIPAVKKKQLKTKNAVTPDMSREIVILYGEKVPTGSRKSVAII